MQWSIILRMLKTQSWKSQNWTQEQWDAYHQIYELVRTLTYDEENLK